MRDVTPPSNCGAQIIHNLFQLSCLSPWNRVIKVRLQVILPVFRNLELFVETHNVRICLHFE